MVDSILVDLTAECRNHFEQGLSHERLMVDEWWENRLADFNLWATGLGASAQRHASLDWRLRNRPDVRDAIVDLLEELKESLEECLTAPNTVSDTNEAGVQTSLQHAAARATPSRPESGISDSGSMSPWSQMSNDEDLEDEAIEATSQDTSISKLFRSIDMNLDQLARISTAIRKSGSRLRYEKADRTLDRSKYQDLIEHLTMIVLRSSTQMFSTLSSSPQASAGMNLSSLLSELRARLSDPIWLTAIQLRLIAANVKRRHRFMWAREYERNAENAGPTQLLEKVQRALHVTTQERSQTAPSTTNKSKQNAESATSQKQRADKQDDSSRSATYLGSQFFVPRPPNTKAASGVTRSSATGQNLDYPRPPRLEGDRIVFECPYCHQALPKKYAQRGWRGHVMQDLRPYVCIFENCSKDQEMFVHSEDWLLHMQEEHAACQWICTMCASDHCEVFHSEAALASHLKNANEHANDYTEAQIPIITKSCVRRASLEIASCPLCQFSEEGTANTVTLIDHIAAHLHEFALRALPWDGVTDEIETGSGAHRSAGEQSLTNVSSAMQEDHVTMENLIALLRSEAAATQLVVKAIIEETPPAQHFNAAALHRYLATFDLSILSDTEPEAKLSKEDILRCIATLRRVQGLIKGDDDRALLAMSEEELGVIRDQIETEYAILTDTCNQIADYGAIVDDAKTQIHREETDFEHYFQDQSVQSTEIEVLRIEKEQLLNVLQKLDPNAATKTWSIEDFQQAAVRTKREYEEKDRMFSGKPQKFFHKIIGKFGTYGDLFKMVPQQMDYTSVVTGAATILISASIQYTDTIEELSRVLSIIDDQAAACTLDSEFYQGEFMQRAVAKFFIAVFLLLGDLAMWYQSSSWKKMRNSLHEGFKEQFENALDNIIRLSKNIQRAAQQAANAEIRVLRIGVEELGLELQDIRAGLTGEFRKMAHTQWEMMQALLAQQKRSEEQSKLEHEQTRNAISTAMSELMRSKTFWREITTHATPLLQNEIINATYVQQQQMSIAYHSGPNTQDESLGELRYGLADLPSMKPKPGTLRIHDLLVWSEALLDYVQTGAGIQTLSDEETPVFFDRRLVMALEHWLQAGESKLLYLEGSSNITAAAMRIVLSADGTDPPVPCASFFCEAQILDDDYEVQTGEADPLLGLIYSLIYQILRNLPPLTEQTLITSKDRFTDLDSTLFSWDGALKLLEDTLNLAPALMIIVVDGLLAFEDDHEYEMRDLLHFLRKQMGVEGKVLKILLTTDRMLFSLTVDLDAGEMIILDAGTQQAHGMIPFIPGGEPKEESDDEYD